jgi:hypothetical protein
MIRACRSKRLHCLTPCMQIAASVGTRQLSDEDGAGSHFRRGVGVSLIDDTLAGDLYWQGWHSSLMTSYRYMGTR